MKNTFCLCLLLFLGIGCTAQYFFEPLVGYGLDVNNSKHPFQQLNTGIQISGPQKKGTFLLRIERGWGFKNKLSDSAFTYNPSLPVYSSAQKKLGGSLLSFAIGSRGRLFSINPRSTISLEGFLGLTYQHFRVSYQYDKANYTVLNPDRNLNITGFFVAAGISYAYEIGKNKLLVQALISSPPSSRRRDYPYSFKYMAPLALNIGYAIPLTTKATK